MPHGFESLVVSFYEKHATTFTHILTITVYVGPVHFLAAPNGYAIVAFGSSATVIPGDEQIVPPVMFHDEWCFDGIGTSVFRCGVGFCVLASWSMPAGNGDGL